MLEIYGEIKQEIPECNDDVIHKDLENCLQKSTAILSKSQKGSYSLKG